MQRPNGAAAPRMNL